MVDLHQCLVIILNALYILKEVNTFRQKYIIDANGRIINTFIQIGNNVYLLLFSCLTTYHRLGDKSGFVHFAILR